MGWVYKRLNKTKPGELGLWKDAKKVEAVTTWLATGNLRLTASIINVPLKTLEHWKKSEWWNTIVSEVRTEDQQATDAKLSKLIDKSLEVVSDRLENGDFILDSRSGKIIRVPTKLRDTNQVLTQLIDKRQLIRREPTKITQTADGVEAHLRKLAEQFERLVNKRETIVEGQYLEVENKELEPLERSL